MPLTFLAELAAAELAAAELAAAGLSVGAALAVAGAIPRRGAGLANAGSRGA